MQGPEWWASPSGDLSQLQDSKEGIYGRQKASPAPMLSTPNPQNTCDCDATWQRHCEDVIKLLSTERGDYPGGPN